VEDDTEEGARDVQPAAIVNQAHFFEPIHEEANAGACGADHLGEHLLMNLSTRQGGLCSQAVAASAPVSRRIRGHCSTILVFGSSAEAERLRSAQAAAPSSSQGRNRPCEHAGHIEVEGHEPQRKQKHGDDEDDHTDRTLSSVDTTMIGYRRT